MVPSLDLSMARRRPITAAPDRPRSFQPVFSRPSLGSAPGLQPLRRAAPTIDPGSPVAPSQSPRSLPAPVTARQPVYNPANRPYYASAE